MYLFHVVSAAPAESSLVHLFGEVFHPVFVVVATVLTMIYGLTASYGIAIVVLTVLIMAVLLPLTVSSTRSMMAMRRLQPKIRQLRQTYAGREHRDRLNQEMMQLYKEEGISPVGGLVPLLVQLPILVVLYDVIRGLNNTVITAVGGHRVTAAVPRYIATSSRMYHNLVAGHGAMNWLGINLSLRPLSAHAPWFGILPYLALIVVATGLQYVQLAQARTRNPVAAEANPQFDRVQKALPIVYVFVYLVIPGAVILYTIVSTSIRILVQRVLFRRADGQPPPAVKVGSVT